MGRNSLWGVALLLVVAACGTSRPSADEWAPQWHDLTAAIPSTAALGDPPDETVCRDSLGLLRSSRGDLFPTPDQDIDDAVNEWVSVAEDAFFECPPSSQAVPDFAAAYEQLARLEAEVEAALAFDRG
jgi:hypothetical protein